MATFGSGVPATWLLTPLLLARGRRKRSTKLEAALKQLVNGAAAGEARAIQLLISIVQASKARAQTNGPEIVIERDRFGRER